MAKKTVNVQEIKEWANNILGSTEPFFNKEFKSGVCATVETVLHKSGNYRGFMFINNEDSEHDTLGYFTRKYF